MKKRWILAALMVLMMAIPVVGMAEEHTHIWGGWEWNPDEHIHYCEIEGCDAIEGGPHGGSEEANCTQKGTCTTCGSPYNDNTKHNWSDWADSGDGETHCRTCSYGPHNDYVSHDNYDKATCSTQQYCSVCKVYYKNPNKHEGTTTITYAKISETDPQHNVTETCNSCHATIRTSKAYHQWGDWALTQDGKQHTRTCQSQGCGATQTGYHTGGNATCITEGECEVCSLSYKNPDNHEGTTTTTYEKISDSQHNEIVTCNGCNGVISTNSVAHTPTTAATCTQAAYCGDCKSNYGSKDSSNHAGDENVLYSKKDDSKHVVTKQCDECYETIKQYTEDHQWSDWKYVDGEQHSRKCKMSSCGAVQYKAHTPTTAATCTQAAYCDVCKSSYGEKNTNNHVGTPTTTYVKTSETQHTPKTTYSDCEHTVYGDPSAHTPTTAATCTEAAYCGVCKKSYGDALSHATVTHSAKAPTCTSGGWYAYTTCSRCTYSTYRARPALGHSLEQHSAQAPTCTAVGWEAYDACSRCSYSTYREITALGHATVTHSAQAPTCTAIGWEAYDTCSRCSYSTYRELPALGHDIVAHAAKAPTCTAVGWEAYDTCSRCDLTTYKELAALGHSYRAGTTAPTCTRAGYTTHTCTRCRASYRDGAVAALGHWYGEWTPNADGTSTAECRRGCGRARTVDCASVGRLLGAGDAALEVTLCPVCGETGDGAPLALVEALAEALTEELPAGEVVVRMGALACGETLMSVAFEYGGALTLPTGQVRITLPAALMEGYTLSLLGEDGTETELPYEVTQADGEETLASFVVDYTDALSPVRVIRLVPVE